MSSLSNITEPMLDALRATVRTCMSAHRYAHTLGVERAVQRMGRIYLPEKLGELRAAALLHDITKEIPLDGQLALCREGRIPLTDSEMRQKEILHARTAPVYIRQNFPSYATDEILSAVSRHTVGAENMSVMDKLLCLSDYIEEGRTYPACVQLREYFFSHLPQIEEKDRLPFLNGALLCAFDGTLLSLIAKKALISADTIAARNGLLAEGILEKPT